LLNERRTLIIDIPNIKSFYSILTNKNWVGFCMPYHINYFTLKTIKTLLTKHDFSKIKATTEYFDLFSPTGAWRLRFDLLISAIFGKPSVENIKSRFFEKQENPKQSVKKKIFALINYFPNIMFTKVFKLGDSLRVFARK